MNYKTMAIAAATLLALTGQPAFAADSVGYNYLSVPGNSDVLLTVPYTKPVAGSFTVSAKTATGVVVTNTLTAGQYANVYFVRFTSGSGNGLWSTISANTANEITLADTAILAQVLVGNTFDVYPHETLESVFPDGLKDVSYLASPSAFSRTTEILIPNTTSIGINKPASATYYYLNNEWRRVGSAPTAVFNATVLPPQQYFTLRNGANANSLKFVTLGENAAVPVARILSKGAVSNDVAAASGFPIGITLAQLNLGGTAAFETSTSAFSRKDEVLVFNNAAVGINKPASATYFYLNGAWRKVGASPTTSFDSEVLTPGSAMLIRKAAGTVGSAVWSQPSPF